MAKLAVLHNGWKEELLRQRFAIPPPHELYGGKFANSEHVNVVASDSSFAVTLVVEPNRTYRLLEWRPEGVKEHSVPFALIRGQLPLAARLCSCCCGASPEVYCEYAIRHAVKDAASVELIELGPRAAEELKAFEENNWRLQAKFGVLLHRPGQTEENEMFANDAGSELWETFLSALGHRVRLSNWAYFNGGLNNKGLSGETSVYRMFMGTEIMYHVSTMLPLSATDKQQLERKRHIGNDQVVIVFHDGISPEPIPCDIVRSKQIQVMIFICPHDPAVTVQLDNIMASTRYSVVERPYSNAELPDYQEMSPFIENRQSRQISRSTLSFAPDARPPPGSMYASVPSSSTPNQLFRVAVTSRDTIANFGPPLPSPPVFRVDDLAAWLPEKLLNAQRAVFESPLFIDKTRKQRAAHLRHLRHKVAFDSGP